MLVLAMRLGEINHISLTVRSLARAEPFYDAILRHLGYRLSGRWPGKLEWDGPGGWFLLREAKPNSPAHDRYHVGLHHLAWSAASRAEVDRFHREVLLPIGATVLDPPGEFPQHGPRYYAVFFADPDGIKLELAHAPR
jgi:catechol 2,3-dioxygenase-like lactoylglutathione lyase family enzyme